MGKGDRRTCRGKLFRGTYGNSRSRRNNKPVPHLNQPPAAPSKEGR